MGDDSKRSVLFFFVNSLSGGQQGKQFVDALEELTPTLKDYDCRVYKILEQDPGSILQECRKEIEDETRSVFIIAAGGDGTVTWVMREMEKLDIKNRERVPVGVVPLGTGNDLSIALGWGASAININSDPGGQIKRYIEKLIQAKPAPMDYWDVTIRYPEELDSDMGNASLDFPKSADHDKKERTVKIRCWNYLSVGQDAKSAYGFDKLREMKPELFKVRFFNKAVYAFCGLQSGWLFGTPFVQSIKRKVKITCDEKQLNNIPSDIQGIVLLNIPGYAGGKDLWGMDKSRRGKLFKKQSISDGKLELVGYRSGLDLALVFLGWKRAERLAQCSEVKLEIRNRQRPSKRRKGGLHHIYMQVDGEPWKMPIHDDQNIQITLESAGHFRMLTNRNETI